MQNRLPHILLHKYNIICDVSVKHSFLRNSVRVHYVHITKHTQTVSVRESKPRRVVVEGCGLVPRGERCVWPMVQGGGIVGSQRWDVVGG